MQRLARTNRVPITNPRDKWSNESLETIVDVVERGINSLQGAIKFWGIPVTSLSNHLYEKTRNKKIRPPTVLIEEKDEAIVAWGLNMQEYGFP